MSAGRPAPRRIRVGHIRVSGGGGGGGGAAGDAALVSVARTGRGMWRATAGPRLRLFNGNHVRIYIYI